MNYREFFVAAIGRGGYELAVMEARIDKCWIEGRLTDADREELLPLAAERADDRYQVDVMARLADLEHRVWELEHPVEQYATWVPGYQTQQHEIVRFDVTGDGELDLCQYNGGRSYTSLGIGKIEGWNMLDRELNATHIITRDTSGGYVLIPVEPVEPAEAPDGEGGEHEDPATA